MRKIFLSDKLTWYKANLHGHTTLSDGSFTPEEVKDIYKKHGYSIIAFSDHEYCFAHPELQDDGFVALTAYEMQIQEDGLLFPEYHRRLFHLLMIAMEMNNDVLVAFSPSEMQYAGMKTRHLGTAKYSGQVLEKREFSTEGINRIIADASKQGFLVALCHPIWSLHEVKDLQGLKGLFAMEIFNAGTELGSSPESYCPHMYDAMLKDGQHIGCLANDDNHNHYPLDDPRSDLFGGFTMIGVPSLSYGHVIDALSSGMYYASRGPLIHSLYFEQGCFHITCSPAWRIHFNNGMRYRPCSAYATDKGGITEAVFTIPDDWTDYIRFTVTDFCGKTANTRAYWPEEFMQNRGPR